MKRYIKSADEDLDTKIFKLIRHEEEDDLECDIYSGYIGEQRFFIFLDSYPNRHDRYAWTVTKNSENADDIVDMNYYGRKSRQEAMDQAIQSCYDYLNHLQTITSADNVDISTNNISLTSIYRISANRIDDETIQFSIYNPVSKYSVKEKININDNSDEIAEYIISDPDIGIERTAENIDTLANAIEKCWYE